MKKTQILTLIMFLSYHVTNGQITTMEEPISFRYRSDIPTLSKSERTMKSFVALDMERIEREDAEDEKNGLPPRFGYSHQIDYTLDNSGEWVTLPDGDKIWRLTIFCQDAQSINLLYDRFWIPDGAKFFVYNNDRNQVIGAVTSANNKSSRNNVQGFATGLVFGDQITLEYYLPSGVREIGIISISNVVHGYRSTCIGGVGHGCSGPCQVNVNCSEGNNWQNEKNAIAMIVSNEGRICSGALVNTTANDGRPLFLTAEHCMPNADAISAPNLDSWLFYWNNESVGCTNTNAVSRSTVGATVVANHSISDFALLELTQDPRNAPDVTPYYLGWDRSDHPGWGGVGIHHPRGDLKKIATHNMIPYSMGDNYWGLYWMQTSNGFSVTEGGSSGSPLINNSRRVIGQLFGGDDVDCNNPANDVATYGKFSVSWTGNNDMSPQRRLRDWLDPIHAGVTVLNGCAGILNLSNQIISTNVTVANRCVVNINNVTITPNGALTVQANAVNIGNNFTVQSGGSFTIIQQ